MRIIRRPLCGLFPTIEPTVIELHWSQAERRALARTAKILETAREHLEKEFGRAELEALPHETPGRLDIDWALAGGALDEATDFCRIELGSVDPVASRG